MRRTGMMDEMNNKQGMNLGEFLERALVWGLAGGSGGLRGSKLAWLAFLGPLVEKVFGSTLEDAAAYIERERQEKQRQEILTKIQAALQSLKLKPLDMTQPSELLSLSQPQLAAPPSRSLEKDNKWREVIAPPSVVLILGKRGSGKSALGYYLLELFRYALAPYVLGLPRQGQGLLPDWIGIAQNLDDIPPKSIVLVDEAYLRYHSRESLAARSREMSRILNLSRQREQTLIFVSQEARQIDKNIASSANVIVFKDLGMLQLEFDRPELNRIATQAKQAFEEVKGDRRRWSYIYSPDSDFLGLLENSLPGFWSNKLGHAFAMGVEASAAKLPKSLTLEERIQKARELRRRELSIGQIAKILGLSKGTVYNYLNDYPYKRRSDH
jgi:hypothetical protein